MAAEIKREYGVEAVLTPGGRGIFDVLSNETLVYSKFETGTFPKPNEVNGLIKPIK